MEDKTFGLKNKNKSSKVQQYIKGVQQQVFNQKGGEAARKEQEYRDKVEKKKAKEANALLASLFKGVGNLKDLEEDDKEEEEVDDTRGEIDLYTDPRGPDPNRSDKICDHFLDAVEKELYGWRWSCLNGEKCVYSHALPAGFVIDREQAAAKALLGHDDGLGIEEIIEQER